MSADSKQAWESFSRTFDKPASFGYNKTEGGDNYMQRQTPPSQKNTAAAHNVRQIEKSQNNDWRYVKCWN